MILPIWHRVTKEVVAKYAPLLAGTFAISTQNGIKHLVDKVINIVRDEQINQEALEELRNKELAKIYRMVIVGKSARELMMAFYTTETLIADFPNYVEAKLLKDEISYAIKLQQKEKFVLHRSISAVFKKLRKLLNELFNWLPPRNFPPAASGSFG